MSRAKGNGFTSVIRSRSDTCVGRKVSGAGYRAELRTASTSLAMLAAVRRASSTRESRQACGDCGPRPLDKGSVAVRGRGGVRCQREQALSPPNTSAKEWCEGWRLRAYENRREPAKPPLHYPTPSLRQVGVDRACPSGGMPPDQHSAG
jgi:hypothetical protein